MALASLVSFQKQKLTVVKIFMELDIEKAVFQRGNKRTFFMPLVDTRFVVLFLELTKKILASVYERLNESSIIPPLKNRFLASDFMKILTTMCFCF